MSMTGFQVNLALSYLRQRKMRTLLTTLAIVLGVMIIFGLNGMVPAILDSFRQNVLVAANQVDLTVTSETRGVFPQARVAVVQDVPGVAHATGSLSRVMLLPAPLSGQASAAPTPAPAGGKAALMGGQGAGSLLVVGIDPASASQVRPLDVTQGRSLEPGDSHTMVIRESLAENAGLALGDTVRLPSTAGEATFEVVGVVSAPPGIGREEVYAPLPAVQVLFNLPGQVSTIEVLFEAGVDAEAVRADVLAALGPGYKAGGNEAAAEWLAVAGMAQPVITLFGVLALVMGGFIIFNTFRTVVVERRRDLAMLRSVGASRRTIMGIVLTESLLQGTIGTVVGIGAGYLLVTGLIAVISPAFNELLRFPMAQPSFGPAVWALAIGLGVGVTLVAGLQPALSASRVSPLEALRPALAATAWQMAGKRAVWGAALVGVAIVGLVSGSLALAGLGSVLFLLGLVLVAPAAIRPISAVFGRLAALVWSREGRMAQGNVVRQPGRSAVTASAMMIGLAVVLAVIGLMSSFVTAMWDYMDTSLGADYLLMPQTMALGSGNVGAAPVLADKMRAVPGVANVTTLRVSTSTAGNMAVQVIGIDPETYPELAGLVFSAGDPEQAFVALGTGRAMIANGIAAGQMGWQPGDEQVLLTPEGQETYRVVGAGVDFMNVKAATVYISQGNLARDFRETTDLLLMANREPGADPEAVEAALRHLVAGYPAFGLFDSTQWRADMQAQFEAMFSAFYGLVAILALPSLIALVNTLGINVLERTREIGMMRAVGATRQQVRRLILVESLLLAAVGTAFGILAGLWLGYVLVGAINAGGFPVAYSFPYAGVLVTLAVGLLFGVAGALIPARHAARLDIVSALAYE